VISRSVVLIASTRALESRWVSVATIPSLFAVIVFASLTKLGIRQRRAQPSHASSSAIASWVESLWKTSRSCSFSR
jgi:hypothetical protein